MNKLVFIVEDDLIQQKMLKLHFEETLGNYSVKTFSNPEELLAHMKENPFAIVLDHFFSDQIGKTGLDYLKLIKKKHPSIAVIYHTSLEDETVRAEVMKLGAEEYIIKNSASLVRLRTTLDVLHDKVQNKKGFLHKLFN
jgi:CheY-like chemotaxis protein